MLGNRGFQLAGGEAEGVTLSILRVAHTGDMPDEVGPTRQCQEAPVVEATVVDGDRDRMERAVWNLLENAGKWSGDGGTVEVALAGGELSVRDHGPGIDEEDTPLVFERFYRSAAARAMPGAGLGLAIVREVAEAHGGTVVAENAAGGGARFRLSLNGAARRGTLS